MDEHLGGLSRRQMLGVGGATLVDALAGNLLGSTRVAQAQSWAGAAPEVDRLAVRVVTDSYHHAFEPSRKIGNLEVQRFSFPLSNEPPSRALMNEWGLSLHVETARGAETRQVLIDFGYTPETLNVRGKGLVVMTSCGHRGVVNSVRAAMKISGISRVHAVLGGFHLAPHAADYQRETVLALKEISPDYLVPMHCSGETFIRWPCRRWGTGWCDRRPAPASSSARRCMGRW